LPPYRCSWRLAQFWLCGHEASSATNVFCKAVGI
jgi:hypothetical protein